MTAKTLISMFFAILALALLTVGIINRKSIYALASSTEKRRESLAHLEHTINQKLPIRKALYTSINSMRYYLFGFTQDQEITVGKNRWLYATVKENWSPVPDLAEKLEVHLKEQVDFFANKNIPMFFTIFPDKRSIYPEHLPDPISFNGSS